MPKDQRQSALRLGPEPASMRVQKLLAKDSTSHITQMHSGSYLPACLPNSITWGPPRGTESLVSLTPRQRATGAGKQRFSVSAHRLTTCFGRATQTKGRSQVPTPALPCSSCGTLDKSVHLSEAQSPHQEIENKINPGCIRRGKPGQQEERFCSRLSACLDSLIWSFLGGQGSMGRDLCLPRSQP